MKANLVALLVGFIFAIGLGLAGMTQPHKIIGFLDLFGNWDPSLLFVMVGAIGVHFFTYKLIRKKASPLLSADWHVPNKKDLNWRLVIGSLIFGLGWGLGGYCPGPAVTSLGSFELKPFLFVISMLVGMFVFRRVDNMLTRKTN